MVLIFWEGCFFASQVLSTKLTPQPVFRHTKVLGLRTAGKIAGSKVINVVAELQPLKARPEPRAVNVAVDFRIGLAEEGLGPVSITAP